MGTSLKEYVGRMKDWQKDIYMFPGESIKTLKESSFMDAFLDRDVEVIYLTEAIDEYFLGNVREFNGHKLRDITKEGVKFSDEDENMAKRRAKVYTETFKPLTKFLKKLYGSDVSRVSISKRLGRAPAVVSSNEWGNSANMDRRCLISRAWRASNPSLRIWIWISFVVNYCLWSVQQENTSDSVQYPWISIRDIYNNHKLNC